MTNIIGLAVLAAVAIIWVKKMPRVVSRQELAVTTLIVGMILAVGAVMVLQLTQVALEGCTVGLLAAFVALAVTSKRRRHVKRLPPGVRVNLRRPPLSEGLDHTENGAS